MQKTLLSALFAGMAVIASAQTNYVMDLRQGDLSFNEDGSWTDVYNEDAVTVDADIFSATHSSMYAGSYDGFVPCTSTDNTDYTSAGWYYHQWGCMAGGAVKVDENGNVVTENGKVAVDAGAPYLMCYWSAWSESDDNHVAQILLSTDETLYAKEIYVCTHPYAYYLLINGDYYTRAFNQADDEFALLIHGLDENFEDNGKVVKYVLTNTVDDGNGTYVPNQSTDWNRVDLSELGQVTGVYFTMTSTDTGAYGINTPTYFCADRFTVSTEKPSGVANVEAVANVAPVYYTIQGVRVSENNLTPGIYVKVANGKATKIVVK